MALLVSAAVMVVSQLYCLLPVFTQLQVALSVPVTDVALLTTFFGFAYAVGFLFWGPISDKFGRQLVMLVGMILLACISVVVAMLESYDHLLMMRVVQGFFAASYPPVALAWIAENLAAEKRMKAIAYMSSAFLLAALIGQLLGEWLIQSSLFTYMLISAAAYAVIALGITFLPKAPHRKPVSLLSIWVKMPAVLCSPRLFKAYLATLFVLASFVSVYGFFAQSYQASLDVMGISASAIRWWVAPFMLIPLFVSKLIIKWGAQKTVTFGLLGIAITLVAQIFLLNMNSLVFILFHIGFVACIATVVPSLIAYVSALADDRHRGLAIALYTFFLFVGASAGAWVVTKFEPSAMYWVSAVLVIVSLINAPWVPVQGKVKTQ